MPGAATAWEIASCGSLRRRGRGAARCCWSCGAGAAGLGVVVLRRRRGSRSRPRFDGRAGGAARGARGQRLRVLARRGERFLVLGEPAEENLGGRMRRARARPGARRRAPRGRRPLSRVGGGWGGSGGGQIQVLRQLLPRLAGQNKSSQRRRLRLPRRLRLRLQLRQLQLQLQRHQQPTTQ